jgi:hypothetical protein
MLLPSFSHRWYHHAVLTQPLVYQFLNTGVVLKLL